MRHFALVFAVLVAFGGKNAYAATNEVLIRPASPRATVTPRPDSALIEGLPQPSAAPTCAYGKVGVHGDPAGCIYACNSNVRRIISGNGCVFSTPDTASTPVAP